MSLQIEYISKDNLSAYVNNAKIHTSEQIEEIKKSIQRFGFNDPVAVWGDKNEIVEGHGRLIAALEMESISKIPVIRLDDLTDEQRRAYSLVHNKLIQKTGFDFNLLLSELEKLKDFDMCDFGVEAEERLRVDDFYEKTDAKKVKSCTCTHCGKVFYIDSNGVIVKK